MNISRSASIYFIFQGFAVVVWWLILLFAPTSRIYFQMGERENILLAFWLPDLFLLAGGSFVAAVCCYYESVYADSASWFVAGTTAYAEFYCASFALANDSGWLGVVLMFPAMVWSGVFAVGLLPSIKSAMFRSSKSGKTGWILTKTLIQIIIVWSLILLVFPVIIVYVENKVGIYQFNFPLQKPISIILFFSVSAIGLSAAVVMARIGRGTPLPLDASNQLVVSGVYSYIRNPMAVSGIAQGLAVGLFAGSPLIMIYAVIGGLIWQVVFRPLEEENMSEKFGVEYEKYRKNVRCWIPVLKKYQP